MNNQNYYKQGNLIITIYFLGLYCNPRFFYLLDSFLVGVNITFFCLFFISVKESVSNFFINKNTFVNFIDKIF